MREEQLNLIRKFFGLNENGQEIEAHKPINRLAYTKEDIDYKLEVIKEMQNLGMTISIDAIGNICGEFKGAPGSNKTSVVVGSHTDSVSNGGRYDGPLGVISGLLTAGEVLSKDSKPNKNIKVVIYACEESSRFGLACMGSRYLADKLKDSDWQRTDRNGITVKDAGGRFISKIQEAVPEIQTVERVLCEGEVENALEAHIEQSDYLAADGKDGATVHSIASALRFKLTAEEGEPMGKEYVLALWRVLMNIMAYKEKAGFRICSPRVASNEINDNLVSNMDVIPSKAQTLFEMSNSEAMQVVDALIPFIEKLTETTISLKPVENRLGLFHLIISGEQGHSGAVDMADRKDAVFANDLLSVLFNMSLNNPNILDTIKLYGADSLGVNNKYLHDTLLDILGININNPDVKFNPSNARLILRSRRRHRS